MKKISNTVFLLFFGLVFPVFGENFYVGTVSDLTNSLASAVSNDVIFLSNGTYVCVSPMVGDSFLNIGAGVTVRSVSGNPADVALDANAQGRVALMTASSWLIGCTVTNGNAGGNYGGGINGGIASNCTITGNSSGNGGGAYNSTLYNCTITGNSASGGGGGGTCGGTLNNCTITGNSASAGGGAYNSTLYNCTITGNSASGGGGGGGAYSGTFLNCISWGNNQVDVSVTESYSCGVGYTGTGSITNDPMFIGGGNYRLQAGSPCINTGTNQAWMTGAKDLDGNMRIWPSGGTVDMGAYEYFTITLTIRGTGIGRISGSGISKTAGYRKEE